MTTSGRSGAGRDPPGRQVQRGLGAPTQFFDRVLQFSIAPLAHSNELLFALGLRGELAQRIADERAQVVARLQAGQTPFDEAELVVEDDRAEVLA